MKLSDFNSSTGQITKVNALLESLYGLTIDCSQSIEDLESVLETYTAKKELMIARGVSGVSDPDYAKSTLICEAIRMHLREIAPHRKKKQRRTT